MDTTYVAALKVGDKILYAISGGAERVTTVARRTPTQVVLSNGVRLTRHGSVIGAGEFSRSYVAEWTPLREARALAHQTRQRHLNRVLNEDWRRLSDEVLAAVVAALPVPVEGQ